MHHESCHSPSWHQSARRRAAFAMVGLIMVSVLAGCLQQTRPDLKRLYGAASHNPDQPPLIFIHGVLGSRLRNNADQQEIWTGPIRQLLFSDFRNLALDIDPLTLTPVEPDQTAFAITDVAAGKDFYRKIINTLEDAGGYVQGTPGQTITETSNRYYLFVYDWRQDNVVNAARLDAFIAQIRRDYQQPELQVDIVAHSMGGLITRYFLRYGTNDVLDDNDFPVTLHGRDIVRRVVLLGTPNLGSVSSVNAFIEGIPVGLRNIPTEVLVTMPSLYQLFPHPINNWIISASGDALDRDLFDIDLWRRFQWSIFDPEVIKRIDAQFGTPQQAAEYRQTLERFFGKSIERARRFVWSLTVAMDESPWELIVLGGDCFLTPARILVEEVKGESVIRLYPNEIARPQSGIDYQQLMLEPGDGTVTKASLLAKDVLDPSVPRHPYSFFPLDYSFFLCEKHDALSGNINFQDNLLHLLLSR